MEQIKAILAREKPAIWVFAGDSITHGARHTLGWRDYTELFCERVRWEMRRYGDFVIKSGVSGWTIEKIADNLEWNILQFKPDVVSIMVGLNDCRHRAEGIPAFREKYLEVIARLRAESNAEIMLHTPNATLITGGDFRVEVLPAYAQAVREIAVEADVPLVDHFAEWSAASEGVSGSDSMHHWMGHGCHPNEYGHRVMAYAIFRALDIWDEKSWTCGLTVPRG